MLNQTTPLDLAFHALADRSRRAIVERLTRGPASVSELAKPLAMSFPAVMQHLAVLEGAQLVASQKIGRVRICRLEAATLDRAEGWLNAQRAEWERRFDRLGRHLEELQNQGGDDDKPD
jgi:DNA-binding transcriptional ArsR family regulator